MLFVVGRNQPPSHALEVIARAYSKGDFLGYAGMRKHPRKINGRIVMSLEPTCKLCWQILKQIREAEQMLSADEHVSFIWGTGGVFGHELMLNVIRCV